MIGRPPPDSHFLTYVLFLSLRAVAAVSKWRSTGCRTRLRLLPEEVSSRKALRWKEYACRIRKFVLNLQRLALQDKGPGLRDLWHTGSVNDSQGLEF
jgi:hypothetical protein